MGVYIKGMKKPNSCEKCRFKYREDEVVGIDFGARCIFSNHFILSIEMDKDCPLVEVPEPHGRLVEFIEVATQDEEDSGTELINFGDVFAAYMKMREAKPVIEAEGE